MADNNDLLQQIRKVVREEVKAETEPINKRLDAQSSSIAQIKTLVEATAAGQKELQETVATKADIQDLRSDLGKYQKKNEQRFENLEEHTGTPNPHKN